MANLRKASCYRNIVRPYTRKSKVRGKDFIKAVPTSKIVNYQMGDIKGNFNYEVQLVSEVPHQVRHNALESSRQLVNRRLGILIGAKGYCFQILAYPHHILRENKMLSGAGADRMQTGMSHAFGRPVGLAAQLKKGKKVFVVRVNENHVQNAKKALELARPRMPGKYSIKINKLVK